MKSKWIIFLCITFSTGVAARILHVPGEYPTIQSAIDAATDGDGILVASGTYTGTIDFLGKSVVLASEAGPDATTINASCVYFRNNESTSTIITGFWLKNLEWVDFGPIICDHASPAIISNVFSNNETEDGSSIYIYSGSPFIANNEFYNNTPIQSEYCNGGSIYAESCEAVIINNYFHGNYHPYAASIEACDADIFVLNNLFVQNEGSTMHSDGSMVQLWNNTFIDDIITSCPDGSYHMRNNIFFRSDSTSYEIDAGRNLTGDPIFAPGSFLPYYLSQAAAGQTINSPALNRGVYNSLMHRATTRSDHVLDTRFTDIGFHFRLFIPLLASEIDRQDSAPISALCVIQSISIPDWVPSYYWAPSWQFQTPSVRLESIQESH